MFAFLVVVVVPFISIKLKSPIRPGVNAELDWILRLLLCILDFRAKRENRSCADIKRHSIQRSIRLELPTSLNGSPRPEVVPIRGVGQVDCALSRPLF